MAILARVGQTGLEVAAEESVVVSARKLATYAMRPGAAPLLVYAPPVDRVCPF